MIVREKKGESLIEIPDDYVVIDIETTGLSPEFDSILEISALKVRSDVVVDRYSTLVRPPLEEFEVSTYIENLTGITSEEINEASEMKDSLTNLYDFIGDSILVGHNVNFDINFLYDNFLKYINVYFENDFVDTLRLFRKISPEYEKHRLEDLCEKYEIDNTSKHRAFSDCEATFNGFVKLKENITNEYTTFEDFQKLYIYKSKKRKRVKFNPNDLIGDESKIDEDNYFYRKNCVFTGKLTRYGKKEASQIVKNIGGFPQRNVTKKTDVLIITDYDYQTENKTSNRKTAEKYNLEGQDIAILPETTFYNLINE